MHIHIGLAYAFTTFLVVIGMGTLWRLGALLLKDSAIGQAMAFMY
jgi:hypothetical protein